MISPLNWHMFPAGTAPALAAADRYWQTLKQQHAVGIPPLHVIHTDPGSLGSVDVDVVIVGGTLGIVVGVVLAQQGWRVLLLERGQVQGRAQEWNVSRSELQVLLDLGIVIEAELEAVIATEYNPARVGFAGGSPFWVKDILNVGVDPAALIAHLQARFLASGGMIREQTPFEQATVFDDGVQVRAGSLVVSGRLLIDAMGHRSSIVQQARQGQQPEGVCLVVGGCAQGIPACEYGDLLYTFTPIEDHCQYFWEAFPARDGRTTYLFTYVDGDPRRFSLEHLFEAYLRYLPAYQGVELAALTWQRLLFGCFPAYRQSPLSGIWARVLLVGDSSGQQSPLSFGGFGALLRHLARLAAGIDQALRCDALDQGSLALLQPYQPNMAVTWLFQQAMRVPLDRPYDPQQVNTLLHAVFQEMAALGEPTLRPFLQDVVKFMPLATTLGQVSRHHPKLVMQIMRQVGIPPLLSWLRDFSALGIFTGLDRWAKAWPQGSGSGDPRQQYLWHQRQQQWRYGSGQDHS